MMVLILTGEGKEILMAITYDGSVHTILPIVIEGRK
jgi:hypothetical protein